MRYHAITIALVVKLLLSTCDAQDAATTSPVDAIYQRLSSLKKLPEKKSGGLDGFWYCKKLESFIVINESEHILAEIDWIPLHIRKDSNGLVRQRPADDKEATWSFFGEVREGQLVRHHGDYADLYDWKGDVSSSCLKDFVSFSAPQSLLTKLDAFRQLPTRPTGTLPGIWCHTDGLTFIIVDTRQNAVQIFTRSSDRYKIENDRILVLLGKVDLPEKWHPFGVMRDGNLIQQVATTEYLFVKKELPAGGLPQVKDIDADCK